jgi:hypothetical protein
MTGSMLKEKQNMVWTRNQRSLKVTRESPGRSIEKLGQELSTHGILEWKKKLISNWPQKVCSLTNGCQIWRHLS